MEKKKKAPMPRKRKPVMTKQKLICINDNWNEPNANDEPDPCYGEVVTLVGLSRKISGYIQLKGFTMSYNPKLFIPVPLGLVEQK